MRAVARLLPGGQGRLGIRRRHYARVVRPLFAGEVITDTGEWWGAALSFSFVENRRGCARRSGDKAEAWQVMRTAATGFKKAHRFEGRIFPTREAARAALRLVRKPDGAEFRIVQDGAGRASIELITANQ
jgi:hypothetical protein